jgi:hypothetical protein
MTRSISNSLSGILQELELERPLLVTNKMLSDLKDKYSISSPAKTIANRLKKRGWLLPTDRKGVWEFIPAEVAGIYSSFDPLLCFRAFLAKYPDMICGLTFQTAAWLYGDSNRAPSCLDVSIQDYKRSHLLKGHASVSVYEPRLPYQYITNVPVLSRESVIVHMVVKPSSVPSWASIPEWLPGFCAGISADNILLELCNRPLCVVQRFAYLIQSVRPDIADEMLRNVTPKNTAWFGDRKQVRRFDKKFLVADSLLPFDPRKMERSI